MDGSTVLVSNISPQLSEGQVRELFECCGAVRTLQLNHANGTCIVTYADPAHARAAIILSGTPLGDRPLSVAIYSGDMNTYPPKPQGPPPGDGEMAAAHQIANERADDIARTVYVGNVNHQLTDQHIREFFSSCGTVTLTKLAGDSDNTRTTRFAFVEFTTMDGAAKALAIGGTMLAGFPLKIRKANNSIMKPTGGMAAEAAPKKDLSAIMAKVAAAQMKIKGKVEPSRRRSRSRSRSRDRSRRGRDRDRDRSSGRDSHHRESSQRGEFVPNNDITCYNCGQRGHMSRNCTSPRMDQPRKKTQTDSHAGMFFNGYKWEPIESVNDPSMQQPNGSVATIMQEQARVFQQHTENN